MRKLPWKRIAVLALFAVAMGYMEAVIVVYIRHVAGIAPAPGGADYRQLFTRLPRWLIDTEQTREAATIVMLVTLALLAGQKPRQQFCLFLLAFGIWDLTYYASLRVLLEWPPSLATMDVLFLIPAPWFAPVWMPIAASLVMIGVGLAAYPHPRRRHRQG